MVTETPTRQVTVYQAAPPAAMALADTMKLAEIFAQSGFFQDSKQMAQAVTKMVAGAELGFGPVASMTGIYIVQGRVTLSANLMAAAVKRSGKYNYRAKVTDDAVEIEFFEWGESVGVSRFGKEDQAKAGTVTDPWKKYPRNMMFARAMSNGVKWYCPDLFAGPTYTPEELGENVNAEGEIVEHAGQQVNLITGEVLPRSVNAPTERPAALIKALADWHEEDQRARANGIEPAERDIDTATYDELRESSTRLFKLRTAAEKAGWPELIAYALDAGMEVKPLPEMISRRAFDAAVEDLAMRVAAKREERATAGEEGPAPAAIVSDALFEEGVIGEEESI